MELRLDAAPLELGADAHWLAPPYGNGGLTTNLERKDNYIPDLTLVLMLVMSSCLLTRI